jgi:hypothetical protein
MKRHAHALRSRAGVTLVELMLALSLAGLLLLGVLLLVDQASDAGTALTRSASRMDAEANGDRLLRTLVARAQSRPDSMHLFEGAPDRTSFDSWCDRAAGWPERCRVTLMLVEQQERTVVTGTLSSGETFPLRYVRGRAVIRYFGRGASGDLEWLTTWGRSIRLPVAMGIVTSGDTIVLRVGERS